MNPLEELKVTELKEALKDKGADTRGSKPALMIRLKEVLQSQGIDVASFVAARRLEVDEDAPDEDESPVRRVDTAAPGPLMRSSSQFSLHSSASRASRVSTLRAAESATKAGLLARAAFLEERQKMEREEQEMRMRKMKEEQEMQMQKMKEEQEMKMKRERLQLQMELAESEAKERTLMEAEGVSNHEVGATSVPALTRTDSEDRARTTEPERRDTTDEFADRRQTSTRVLPRSVEGAKQPDAVEVVISQLQRTSLPRPELPVFKGEITKYRSFIRAFESRIASKTEDDDERLFYLEQYCTGKPKEVISGCLHMDGSVGYREARRLLERRYGDPESVSCAFVDMILDWSQLRAGDIEGLDRFSLALTSCKNVMEGIPPGTRETDHPRTMRKVVEKLPSHLQDSWRRRAHKIADDEKRRVCFDDIVAFVNREVSIQTDHTFGKRDERPKKTYTVSATAVTEGAPATSRPTSQCLFCRGHHFTDLCPDLTKLQWEKRREFVRENRLCFGCLRKGHSFRDCFRKLTCEKCKRRHPTAMHQEGREAESRQGSANSNSEEASSRIKNGRLNVVTSEVSARVGGDSSVMMAILPVKVWNADSSRSVVTYAFLDLGSSATFCTPRLLKALDIDGEDTRLTITTATTENQRISSKLVKGLKISDIEGQTVMDMPTSYTLNRIPVDIQDIATPKDLERWPHLQEVMPCRVDAEIGVLIGANCPRALTPLEVRGGEEGCPFALRTPLGWVVYGPRSRSKVSSSAARVNRIRVQEPVRDEQDLHSMFVSLYNNEFGDHGSQNMGLSRDDQRWLSKVEEGVRFVEGHFEIPLPLRDEQTFPNNKQQAEQRTKGLKKRMLRDEKYLKDYSKFVNELIEKDYAEKVSRDRLDAYSGRTWYIPHHGVYHAMKPEKIRVVYDCSASYQGVSINDRLLQGPNLTSSLIGVLLRFREEPFAIMGDVEKMFYQVRVPAKDRSLLRFLWWPDGDLSRPLEEYHMNVHLFGATSSPSCANFALRRTAQDYGSLYSPEVAQCIERNFYVDDFLKSASTEDEAAGIALKVRECCARGGFKLTGFVSNSAEVMLKFPEAERAVQKKLELTGNSLSTQPQRALGVQWDVSEDTLSFRIDVKMGAATRRGLLSTVSAVYDPLGLGAPFIMPAKILLQDLCRLKLEWDEPIPDVHLKRWNQWCEELQHVREFSVPRSVSTRGEVRSCQLHMFADASEAGYGAVGYVRAVDSADSIRSSLLMSKARVAPLKTCTIPRLELAAAALAVQLSTQILSELDLDVDEVYFWTDSVSTLRYITNTSSRFQTFVANRLSIIHDGSSPDQWKYVPSALNPADCLSRGQSAHEFLRSRWANGPQFLEASMTEWPEQTSAALPTEDVDGLEVKRGIVTSTVAERDFTSELLSSMSSWHKLKKRVAWWLRLKSILRQRSRTRRQDAVEGERSFSSRLTVQELDVAEAEIVRFTQKRSFPGEFADGAAKKSSPLRRLNPYVAGGIIRVGGRLDNAAIPEAAKHQAILPKKGHVTDLIIRDAHERKGHSGREHVLAVLREKYWIVDGNAAVRRVLSKCVRCRRIQGPMVTQMMSDLPEDRTTPHIGVFSRVGADYFGPFYVKVGRKQHKRFCVLFTCLATHAIHIEVCDSLDTSSFINALRRFQARRGQVQFIRSDNGTNFVGAERELREELRKLQESKVHDFLLADGVEWRFTPPGASSQGGVWERQIRSIRKVLNAVLREQTLTDESLQTLLCEVEAVLNSRPLTTVSSDPSDLQPLTPNDLLLLRGGPVPIGVFGEQDSYAGRRWKQVQYLADVFWKRWVQEYLPLLQFRQKWNKVKRNLTVGDVVLVADMNSPRCHWPLGRVLEVFPDRKGLVRSAMIRTVTSVLKRPISKLVLVLETETTGSK